MRLLVCVKRVPAPGARINVTPDGQDVDAANLGFTTSPHEECAVEEAVRIAEATAGEVTVLTVGPSEAEEQLRYAASVGADRCALVPTDGSPYDPQRTAAVVAEAVRRLEGAGGAFDLVLFGNESADSGGFQVGIRVAFALARPVVNGAKAVAVRDRSVEVRREVDGGFEVYELPMPAVVGVKEGINLPRYPTMKGRLAARKADVESLPIDAPAGGQVRVGLRRPPETATDTEVLGQGPDAASAVVDVMDALGVLP